MATPAWSADPRARRLWLVGVVLALGIAALAAPVVVDAWPAIQDGSGAVFLCDSRPTQQPDGLWSCRAAGGTYTGALVEVVRPGTPPGTRPADVPRGVPYRYPVYPWGRPPSEPSGYDALDPWLGGGHSSER